MPLQGMDLAPAFLPLSFHLSLSLSLSLFVITVLGGPKQVEQSPIPFYPAAFFVCGSHFFQISNHVA